MTRLAAAALLLYSLPAQAGWTLEYRPSIGTGLSTDGATPLHLDNTVALSPLRVGPRLEITTGHEFGAEPRSATYGLGLRQPLLGGLSAGAHAVVSSRWGGGFGSDNRIGAQGMLDLELVQWEHSGIGLHLDAGFAPSRDDGPYWWSGAGLVVRFGGQAE